MPKGNSGNEFLEIIIYYACSGQAKSTAEEQCNNSHLREHHSSWKSTNHSQPSPYYYIRWHTAGKHCMINQPHHLKPCLHWEHKHERSLCLVGAARRKHKMKASSEQAENITIYILKS